MSSPDRRRRMRFPLQTDLRFQIIRRGQGKFLHGTGQAVDMSSRGLAFRTDVPLSRGLRLSVSLAWPAMLDEKCLLRLVLEGTVLRCDHGCVVVSIDSHEFRTGGRAKGTAREEISALVQNLEQFVPARPADAFPGNVMLESE